MQQFFCILVVLAAGAVLLASGGRVHGAQPEGARLLASNCFQCHGTNGNPVGGFGALAGKSVNKIYDELAESRSGEEGVGIMTLHARGYTEEQLRAIAEFFSRQQALGKRSK